MKHRTSNIYIKIILAALCISVVILITAPESYSYILPDGNPFGIRFNINKPRTKQIDITDTLQNNIIVKPVVTDSIFYIKSSDDTTKNVSIDFIIDSSAVISDTIIVKQKSKKGGLDRPVFYKCTDSLEFDMENKEIYLFNETDIKYDDINLTAYKAIINYDNSEVKAEGLTDSLGNTISGAPLFDDKGQKFEALKIRYNYKTKKGRISSVVTEQGEGYLHGGIIKRMDDETVNVKYGSFTTCNLPHPHYEFRFWKASVIPDKYIASGPAYMVIEDMPTPLIVPFGLFPNKKGQRSGIVIPTFGDNARKGFYLRDGGYYWAINDYVDLQLTGSIYTQGSWGLKPVVRYAKRYKFSGNFLFEYEKSIEGEKGAADYTKVNNFRIVWNHVQAKEANPNITFSSSVNFMSSNFNNYNYTNINNTLSSTFVSSISLQAKLSENWNLSAGITLDQNTSTKNISIKLPSISISANTWNPFRRKEQIGKIRWYENITVNYDMQLENRVNVAEKDLLTEKFFKNMNNGMVHNVAINIPFKLLKFISFNNTLRLSEKFYSQQVLRHGVDTADTRGYVVKDTVYGFKPVFEFSYTAGMSTKIYGMYKLKNDVVKAFRHVMTPSVSLSFRPDFSTKFWGYYDTYTLNDKQYQYSKFSESIYGAPGLGSAGTVTMSLDNNLEMKIRNRKDTITGEKRIKLIESFRISTSYDFLKDSLRWSPLNITAYTTLFNAIRINFACSFNPYATDANGRLINKFEKDVTGRLLRFDSYSWNLSLDWGLNSSQFQKNKKEKVKPPSATDPEWEDYVRNPERYIDFGIAWDFRISYILNYGLQYDRKEMVEVFNRNITQTINIDGSINITPKTKVALRTGYDIQNHKISFSELNIVRDLHCWELGFRWIPFGQYKQWEFRINVKASMLQDLKLTRKRDMRDF